MRDAAPLHVGLFAPALPQSGSANGVVTYTRFIQTALRELGHRVTVIAHEGIEHSDGSIEAAVADRPLAAKLVRLATRFRSAEAKLVPSGATIVRSIRAAHRQDPFDVVEMEESFGWVGDLGLDVPVVARLHGPHFLGKDDPEPAASMPASVARIAAEGRAIAAVDGVTSPSARLLDATLTQYGIAPRRAAAIYNPVATAPSAECWSIDRCDPDQLLFVGRFDLRKGADIAVRAFAIAAARNPKLRLVMCGPDRGLSGADGVPVHFPDYLAKHVAPELHARLRYAGSVPPAEIVRLRLESGLCLSTSRFETFGYNVAEALAMGMPLIASDMFGIPELLRHGENGYIAPVADPEAVAATITNALADRSALARVGAAGRSMCAVALQPAKLAEETVAFYRSLG